MQNLIPFALLGVVLVAAAVSDWRTGKIPNWLTLSAIAAGLLLHAALGFAAAGGEGLVQGLADSGLALLAGFLPCAAIYFAGALGGGDVKLFAAASAIGASLGFVLALAVTTLVLAAAMAVLLMLRHRIVMRTLRRIAGAALTAAARVRPTMPDDSPRVPLALPMCVGGLLAGLEHLLAVPMPWTGW